VIAIPADDLLLNRRDTANRSDREMTLDVMFEKRDKYEERKHRVEERLSTSIKKVLGSGILPETLIQTKND